MGVYFVSVHVRVRMRQCACKDVCECVCANRASAQIGMCEYMQHVHVRLNSGVKRSAVANLISAVLDSGWTLTTTPGIRMGVGIYIRL